MSQDFYFYDLETTGLNPIKDRIIQFGGQRLDANLEPISEVEEFYIKLAEDVLPSAGAIAVHQILPQIANLEGLNEYQFINYLEDNIYRPSTIYGGYNIDDFDNQFMHWLHWRNFALPSPMAAPQSFDIYKLARLAADLRPEGINWHRDAQTSKLSLSLGNMTEANKVATTKMHSAAGDTLATVSIAKLIKDKQAKLFDHYLQLLNPQFIKNIVISDQPFLYSDYNNLAFGSSTTLATVLCEHPTEVESLIVYDLRQPVDQWLKLNDYDWSLLLEKAKSKDSKAIPVSVININQVPVVAPISVLDQASAQRLKLQKTKILSNLKSLRQSDLAKTVEKAYLTLASRQQLPAEVSFSKQPVNKADQAKIKQIRLAKPNQLGQLNLDFEDVRFKHLQFLYQARNFPKTLKTDQLIAWEKYRQKIFLSGKPSGLDNFRKDLRRSLMQYQNDAAVINLLEELQLYIESIMPTSIA